MNLPLKNLIMLKDDMQSKEWSICSFLFCYKSVEYIVLVKRFVGTERRDDKYALVKLHFMKSANLSDDLSVEANSQGLIIDVITLRKYFGIKYSENLGYILQQFAESLGKVIPVCIPDNFSKIEEAAMVRSLSQSDSENPNKIYCTSAPQVCLSFSALRCQAQVLPSSGLLSVQFSAAPPRCSVCSGQAGQAHTVRAGPPSAAFRAGSAV